MSLEVRQKGWRHGLTEWKEENVDLKGYTVFCILCKVMSVVNFVTCNLNEYIQEITLKKLEIPSSILNN